MKFVRGSIIPFSRYTAPRMQIQGPATAIIIDGELQQSRKLLKAPCAQRRTYDSAPCIVGSDPQPQFHFSPLAELLLQLHTVIEQIQS